MKRYRLVEASSNSQMYLQEGMVDRIRKVFSPILYKSIPLDWNKIEKRLGGPVPKDVRARVEKECDGLTFKGSAFVTSVLVLVLGFWWIALPLEWGLMKTFLFFVIGICSMYIIRTYNKKKMSRTGIDECVRCAENDELRSDIAWQAVFSASTEGKKVIDTQNNVNAARKEIWSSKITICCVAIILSISVLQFLGVA